MKTYNEWLDSLNSGFYTEVAAILREIDGGRPDLIGLTLEETKLAGLLSSLDETDLRKLAAALTDRYKGMAPTEEDVRPGAVTNRLESIRQIERLADVRGKEADWAVEERKKAQKRWVKAFDERVKNAEPGSEWYKYKQVDPEVEKVKQQAASLDQQIASETAPGMTQGFGGIGNDLTGSNQFAQLMGQTGATQRPLIGAEELQPVFDRPIPLRPSDRRQIDAANELQAGLAAARGERPGERKTARDIGRYRRYYQGDEYLVGLRMSEERVGRVQAKLVEAGYLAKGEYRARVWDLNTANAMYEVLRQSNVYGRDWEWMLNKAVEGARGNPEFQNQLRRQSGQAPLAYEMPDPAELSLVAEQVSMNVLGRKFTPEEQSAFANAYNAQLMASQYQANQAQESGGSYYQVPDMQTAAQIFARQTDPAGVAATEAGDIYGKILDLIGVNYG